MPAKRKRIRVEQPVMELDTPGWLLVIRADPPDKGGRYEFVRASAAAEIVAEHNERRRKPMSIPESHELEAMKDTLSRTGWKITRVMLNMDELIARALK